MCTGTPGREGPTSKILIVEDEFLLAMHMEQVLTEAGFRVVGEACEGEEAIQLAAQTNPDLVMMDVHLRGSMDGVQTAREIWDRFGIRTLFLTGNADIARSPRAADAHPAGVLEKPVDDGKVLRTLTRILESEPAPQQAAFAGG